jgi:hypothetical protein
MLSCAALADTDPLLSTPEPIPTAEDAHAQAQAEGGFGVTAVNESGTEALAEAEAEADKDKSEYKINYSVTLPRIEDERAAGWNTYFEEMARYYVDEYTAMMLQEFYDYYSPEGEEKECALDVDYTLTYASEGVLSFLLCEARTEGSSYTERYTAIVYSYSEDFPLSFYEVIPWEDENPYSLAVHTVEREIKRVRGTDLDVFGYYEGINEDWIAAYLTDTSFYLDEAGNVILFLNPASVSPCTSGICVFALNLD